MKPPPTPELDRMRAVKDRSHAIGEFLDWVREQNWFFAKYHEHTKSCFDEDDDLECGYVDDQIEEIRHGGIEKLLATYFEIDLDKVDKEKRALLAFVRKQR